MAGDRKREEWYDQVVEDTLPSADSEEHEAPTVVEADVGDQPTEAGGYPVHPGVVKRSAPGRHVIDSNGDRRQIID